MRNKEYGIIINGCVYAAFSYSPARYGAGGESLISNRRSAVFCLFLGKAIKYELLYKPLFRE